ncbi:MAG: DNA mismatch repair endonuclease MutL [Clostridiales bacterium]|nr:DNA mismatch repair endonuclease MutL [Clostridiales bacterium]
MPLINRLSKHMANLIAAGEVVERPASAAKELVENSIDAGAKRITVEIKNGGISLLRVTDDGCGIEPDQAETAFQRYATSKISKEEDLFGIGTMGFRGEALAAIAAVSRTTMLTSVGDGTGRAVTVEGGAVTENTEAGCPKGTTIAVRDLFYNTPARHKFLKKDSSEAAAVQNVCTRAALAHPEISFRLIRDGETVLSTPGDGDLFSAIYCIYGREFASGLLKVEYTLDECSVSGYVTRPDAARKNRSLQVFFVNTRPVKSLMLQSSVEEAFRQRMVSGRYPVCFLNISLPLEAVDVNVHPTKTEVKFSAERRVFETVYYGVKTALNGLDGISASFSVTEKDVPGEKAPEKEKNEEPVRNVPGGSFSFSSEEKPFTAEPRRFVPRPVAVVVPERDEKEAKSGNGIPPAKFFEPVFAKNEAGEKSRDAGADAALPRSGAPDGELRGEEVLLRESAAFTVLKEPEFMDEEKQVHKNDNISSEPCDIIEIRKEENFRIAGEIFGVYIVAERGDEVLFIDKHAAHERIRYNELRSGAEKPSAQVFLEPPVAVMEASDKALILENLDSAAEAGFEIEDFGGTSLLVRSVPEEYVGCDISDALTELLGCIGGVRSAAEKRDRIMKMIACKTAVRSGDKSDIRELEALAERVLNDPSVRTCPHGRPVMISMTKTEIEKRFSRIV